MTNNEYEKLSVESATGESEIAWIDARIEHHLRQVDVLMERRRELINRFNLNKPAPTNDNFDGDYRNGDFYEGAE